MHALVVTIDCEEEGLWSKHYRPTGNSCRNLMQLPRAHEVFARLGVVPTYLVDHPVAAHDAAVRVLRDLAQKSEIGAHLHPWCTPPLAPGGSTYAHRLPPALQEAKLATLCDAIAAAFGARPRSYRAGRWAFDRTTVPALERLGFTVDTSVDPLWWDPEPGGPAFVRAPQSPHRLTSALVEVPVSTAITGRHGRALERVVRAIAPLPGLRRWLVRAGLASLKPEIYPLERMCAVANELAARGRACFNVMFHSSTLLPGATPYVANVRERDEFLRRLGGLLEHLVWFHGARPLALAQVPAWLDASADSYSATNRAAAAASE